MRSEGVETSGVSDTVGPAPDHRKQATSTIIMLLLSLGSA
jgi:hypothetical protein